MQAIQKEFEGKTRLFVPCGPKLRLEHLGEIVYQLQVIYHGIATVSRTPGGLVIHRLLSQ